ncbi:MAG: hypothetical protein QW207_03490 [Candidatus Micrarchaeaceae archaeon]
MAGIGKILIGAVLLIIVLSMMTTLDYEHGNVANATMLNNSFTLAQIEFNHSIYNPLNKSIIKGINTSADLQSSSQTIGFALAFILPDFITSLNAIIQAPYFISSIASSILSVVPTGGVPVSLYVGYAIDVLIMYVLLWGLSLWMKMPTW